MRTSRPIRRSILFLIGLFLTLTACQAPSPVSLVSIENVCQIEYAEKTLTTDGYFSLDVTVFCSDETGDRRCGVLLNRYPDGDMDVSAQLKEGKRPNQMLPMASGYTEADFQVKTDNEEIVGVGDHVTVTGEMMVTESACVMYVDKVEMFSPAP